MKMMLELNDQAGIKLVDIFLSMVVEANGYDNLNLEKKIAETIDKLRRHQLGIWDVEDIQNYFVRMQRTKSI